MPSMPLADAPALALAQPKFWMKVRLHTRAYRNPAFDLENETYSASIFYDEERNVYMYEIDRDPRWPVDWLRTYDKIKHDIPSEDWRMCRHENPPIADVLFTLCDYAEHFYDFEYTEELINIYTEDVLKGVSFNEFNQ